MLAEPGWSLRFSASPRATKISNASLEVVERIELVRRRFAEFGREIADVAIEVVHGLPLHSGLGSGTQLAAAVAFGLEHFTQICSAGMPSTSGHVSEDHISLTRLIHLSGRGKRSGIGLYGFLNGGLILDEGYPADPSDQQSRSANLHPRQIQAAMCRLNPAWRIVLVIPDGSPPVWGDLESDLMDRASRQPNPYRLRMLDLAQRAIQLGSAEDGFEPFTAAVAEFVQFAGRLFSICQAGIYNGEAVRCAVELAQHVGLRAVGQSSWGPTVFGFAPNEDFANQAVRRLGELVPSEGWRLCVATPAENSANWKWIQSS